MPVHAYRLLDPAAAVLCGATDARQALGWANDQTPVLPAGVTCRGCRWVASGNTIDTLPPKPEQSHPQATHGTGYDTDLLTRFLYHPPEPEQAEVYVSVRDLGHLLALLIEDVALPSRERSLAMTHIEEAVMWANASIARRGLSASGKQGIAASLDHAITALRAAKPYTHVLPPLAPTADWAPDPDWDGPTQTAWAHLLGRVTALEHQAADSKRAGR
jgi:hypothetical protein